MPNRIIREAILSSEKMALLGWPEEVFYRRLMSIVDDYGRFEANPQLLKSRCYPLQTDLVRVADISRWMAACQKAGLILHYELDGKHYLELIKFGQQTRTASKYPAPPASDSSRNHLLADAHLVVSGVVDVIEEKPRKRDAPRSVEKPESVQDSTWADWLQLRKAKRAPVTATVLALAEVEAAKAGMPLDRFLAIWCARGSQGLEASWLKDEKSRKADLVSVTTPGPSPSSFLADQAAHRAQVERERQARKQAA